MSEQEQLERLDNRLENLSCWVQDSRMNYERAASVTPADAETIKSLAVTLAKHQNNFCHELSRGICYLIDNKHSLETISHYSEMLKNSLEVLNSILTNKIK